MKDMPKKILISGGWGYGNIGDDAILVSTIKLLKAKYPSAELVVMTYNVDETRRNVNIENVKYVFSIHWYLAGNLPKKKFNMLKGDFVNKQNSFLELIITKAFNKLNKRLIPSGEKKAYRSYQEALKNPTALPNYQEFLDADLFIQGGGGYFNGGWVDNVYAHVLELIIAKNLKIKSLVIGQSIGPFHSPLIHDIALSGLKSADLISVRDAQSFKELVSQGIQPVLIPDTALSQIDFSYKKKSNLTVVVGGVGLTKPQIIILAKAIEVVAAKEKLSVTIIISRTWLEDTWLADKLYKQLVRGSCKVEFVIPRSYLELQNALGESKIVVSQNLHGLILAWRAGVPTISINTERKFVAFMEQTDQKHHLIPTDEMELRLEGSILSVLKEAREFGENRTMIAKDVTSKFYSCLESVMHK